MYRNRTNSYGFFTLLNSKSCVIKNNTVNGINLFVSGCGFCSTWPRVNFCIAPVTLEFLCAVLYSCIGRLVLSKCLQHVLMYDHFSFVDFLMTARSCFLTIIELSHISCLRMGVTCAEIKTGIRIFPDFEELLPPENIQLFLSGRASGFFVWLLYRSIYLSI